MFPRQKQKKQCANQNHKDETHLACSLYSVHARTHVFNTFIWNCSEYSKVSRIYSRSISTAAWFYVLSCTGPSVQHVYWLLPVCERANQSVPPAVSSCCLRGSQRLPPWNRRRRGTELGSQPSDQNTSWKTIGGKKKTRPCATDKTQQPSKHWKYRTEPLTQGI